MIQAASIAPLILSMAVFPLGAVICPVDKMPTLRTNIRKCKDYEIHTIFAMIVRTEVLAIGCTAFSSRPGMQ